MSARASSKARSRAKPKEGLLERLLDPIDLLSEAIYSILIVLTFTLAFRIARFGAGTGMAATTSSEQVNQLLMAAVGAALAWGVIDGIMYVLMSVFERGEKHRLLRGIHSAETEQEGLDMIEAELDHILEPITQDSDRRDLYRDVLAYLREGELRPIGLKREDIVGAFGSVLVAVGAVLPSLVPLALIRNDPFLAIRASNVVSFIMLFILGYRWGAYTSANPWKTGVLLVAAGVIMTLVAISLGG